MVIIALVATKVFAATFLVFNSGTDTKENGVKAVLLLLEI